MIRHMFSRSVSWWLLCNRADKGVFIWEWVGFIPLILIALNHLACT